MDITTKINFDFSTIQRLIKLIGQIDSFKGRWQAVESRDNVCLKELRKIATIQSIGSSTRIEGATLTDNEVRLLLADIKVTKLTSRDEHGKHGETDPLKTEQKGPLKTAESDPQKTEETDPQKTEEIDPFVCCEKGVLKSCPESEFVGMISLVFVF